MKPSLAKIAAGYGTDKDTHQFAGTAYTAVYEYYFQENRLAFTTILEIGVLHGASLLTWRDYFPDAMIWGLDIDPSANRDYGHRIKVITGSQIDPGAIARIAPGQEFDVVIDDGSHVVDHLVETFRLLWPRVKPGGFYVMEDLKESHRDITGAHEGWPGQRYNRPDTNYKNDRRTLDKLFGSLLKDLDEKRGDARFIHFWHQQAFIGKIG